MNLKLVFEGKDGIEISQTKSMILKNRLCRK